jgi:ATP-dependent Clp protease ATP-binding subunit ClpX
MDKDNRYIDASLLKAELDGYVMGQEEGIRRVAMAVSSHLIRIRAHAKNASSRIRKDNMLLVGPSGCGKTETFRVLQRLEEELGIPIIMRAAMSYSPNRSWKGIPLENILSDLYDEATVLYCRLHGDMPESAEEQEELETMLSNGIILLDEFDKVSLRPEASKSFCREYQAGLLKMVEGDRYCVGNTGSYDEDGEPVNLDTSNVMFIFLGAFDGLEKITRERLEREREKKSVPKDHKPETNPIGFMAKIHPVSEPAPADEELPEDTDLTPSLDDLIEYGIIRELAGRIPIRTVYKPLSVKNMVKIMQESKTSAYLEYQERFQAMGHSLNCDNAALREIARMATERKTGARGLSDIFNELLSPTMYKLSGTGEPMKCILRGSDIKKHQPPILQLVRQQKIKNRTARDQA